MTIRRRESEGADLARNPLRGRICRHPELEAFPWDSPPRYLIRDRDTAYGPILRQRLRAMGIRDKPTAPRSPWQNPYVERLIGTIRRECLDHMIVFGEAHLRRILGERLGVITSQPVLGGHIAESQPQSQCVARPGF